MSDHKFRIYRYLGRSLSYRGLSVGWNWVHGNGYTSKTSASIASYHHPDSITWRWALYYHLPRGWKSLFRWPRIDWRNSANYLYCSVNLPFVGGLSLTTQAHMWKQGTARHSQQEAL